jgi:hypothetical protein
MSRRAAGLFISLPSRVSAGVKLIVLRDSLTADIIFNLHVTRYQPAVPTSRGEKGSQRDGYLFTPRRVYMLLQITFRAYSVYVSTFNARAATI